ncbi:MAG: hypothetical protein V1810_03555 [Candidatus Beckwithbacteria bacterium]
MVGRLLVHKLVLLLIFIVIIGTGYFLWSKRRQPLSDWQIKQQRERVLSMMKTKLPETSLLNKTLPIISYVLPNATCYYFAGASVAHFLEKDIDFDKFLWYGRPLRFKFDQRFGDLRTGPPAGDLFMEAFYNLGYKTYQGNTSGILMPAIFMTHMTADDNFIFFKKQAEAFDFIKRLISADQPVILNGAPMPNMEKGDYGFFAGYNDNFVYIRPIPDKHPFYYQEPEILTTFYEVPIKKFLEIWNRTDNTFYWFEKTHERISEGEIYQMNKADAKETYSNMQKFINNLSQGAGLKSYSSNGDGVNSRAAASRYLRKGGYFQLADKYMEIAKLYNEKEDFSKIADREKEAAKLWK